MNETKYKAKYEIKTIRSPIYLWHSSVETRGDIQEYEDIVVSTNTCSTEDLKQMFVYGWAMQAFHSLGILEYISKFYYQKYKLEYIDFYDIFIEFCKNGDTIFNKEYLTVKDYIETGYSGGGWNHHDETLSDIFWPIEEATWLRCVLKSVDLSNDIRKFVLFLEFSKNFNTEYEVIFDLVKFQVFLLMTRDRNEEIKEDDFSYHWKEFVSNDGSELIKDNISYRYKNKIQESTLKMWCHQAAWIGRAQGNYKCHPEQLDELKYAS